MFKPIITPRNATGTNTETKIPSAKGAITSLSLAMLLSSLGTSSANVALPTLARTFNASIQEVQWIILAYLLAITTMIVSAGRLGDSIGRKYLLLIGLIVFTAASILCGIAPALGWLIACRVVQGLGAAIMMALTMALVRESVPQDKVGSAMGLLGTMSAIGTALGPSLGGFLITGFGWRSLFLINVPLGVLAFVLSCYHLPGDPRKPKSKRLDLDLKGSAWLTLSLGAYALAMTLGSGSLGPLNGALLMTAFAGVGQFIRTEAKASSPLINLSLFRIPVLSESLVMSALVATVVMATLVVGPFYLSRGLNLDTGLVGLVMTTGPLVAALAGMPSGRAVDRFGAQRMTTFGLMAMAAGALVLSFLPATIGILGYIIPLAFITAGYALFQTANNTAVMKDVPPDQRGVMSGVLNLSRNLGLITGSSVMGAVFSIASAPTNLQFANAESIAAGTRTTFGVAVFLISGALVIALGGRRVLQNRRG